MKKKFTHLKTFAFVMCCAIAVNVHGQRPNGTKPADSPIFDSKHSRVTTIVHKSGFDVDNNFGPGESGTLTPYNTVGSFVAANWVPPSSSVPVMLNPMFLDNGRITIGGTQNVVAHQVIRTGSNKINSGDDAASLGLKGDTAKIYVEAPVKTFATDTKCDVDPFKYNKVKDSLEVKHIPYVIPNTVDNDIGLFVSKKISLDSLNWEYEFFYEAPQISIERPKVPDGTGVLTDGAKPAYNDTTKITVDGSGLNGNSTSIGTPWHLEQFQFLPNPWFYGADTLTEVSVIYETAAFITKSFDKCETDSAGKWVRVWFQFPSMKPTAYRGTATHKEVSLATASPTLGGYLTGKIELVANSHVRLDGGDTPTPSGLPGKSISYENLGSTQAYLDLPSTFYSLMNDRDVDLDSITVKNISPLGVDAVFGLNQGFKPSANQKLKTNTQGGTILIGDTLDVQQHLEIQTTSADQPSYGFSDLRVYTGTNIGKEGTANLGNYGDNKMEITNSSTLFGTIGDKKVGKSAMQVYNHSCNPLIFKDDALQVDINDKGDFLIDGRKLVHFLGVNQTFNATATGRTVILGGDVRISMAEHTFNGQSVLTDPTNLLHYLVEAVGKDTLKHAPPYLVYCGDGNITANQSEIKVSQSKQGTMRWYAHNNIHLIKTPSIFTLGTKGHAIWRAKKNILVTNDSPTQFLVKGEGHASWRADDMINVQNSKIDFLMDLSSTGYGDWYAKKSIFVTDSSSVTFDLQGKGAGKWRADQEDIIVSTASPITFKTGPDNPDSTRWYAGRNISVNKNSPVTFDLKGTGSSLWHANSGNITIADKSKVNFISEQASNMDWYAKWSIFVTDKSPVTFDLQGKGAGKWHADQGDIKVSTSSPIIFNTASDNPDSTRWYAGNSISVTGYSRVTFDLKGTGHSLWHANRGDITIADTSRLDFKSAQASNMDWYAKRNIFAQNGSRITFVSEGTGHFIWHADLGDIDVQKNSPVEFEAIEATSSTTHYTHLLAGNDILYHDNSTLSVLHGENAGSLRMKAGRDIRTGINSPLCVAFKSDSVIFFDAGRNIWTQSEVMIINDGQKNNTRLHAGQDIRIDSLLTFNATKAEGIERVELFAKKGSIIVNSHTDDFKGTLQTDKINVGDDRGSTSSFSAVHPCDGRRAPVHFTLAEKGTTLWRAGKDIISNDTISFHYDNTGNNVGQLYLTADRGNIDLRRIINIDYDSKDEIRWEAKGEYKNRLNKHEFNQQKGINCYKGTQNFDISPYGSIRTSDSVNIRRTNVLGSGPTNIIAYNDIQTAMFDFHSASTDGDSLNVISRMGDIWLGYSHKNPLECYTNNRQSYVDFDQNRFLFRVPTAEKGKLTIKAGYEDQNTDRFGGGNIYFTHIDNLLKRDAATATQEYDVEISIPHSNMFDCALGDTFGDCNYERAGIIGGVARCQESAPLECLEIGLIHRGNDGRLLVDAGTRGNIIINNGVFLDFNQNKGEALFLTRLGDVDMRHEFNVDSMKGGLLFQASSTLPNKLNNQKGCDSKMHYNNVYLQDFQYRSHGDGGSVFVGADNNIKLQYGGLKDGRKHFDPDAKHDKFVGGNYPCNSGKGHCDSNPNENQARRLILDFSKDANNDPITKGGFAAVASDLIDVYKDMIYTGGEGAGMSAVPDYTTLQGESVQGYGLYVKTQANKDNWNPSGDPKKAPCVLSDCSDFLHHIARVTMHADARIYTENQRSYIASPVFETYGHLELNTHLNSGSKTSIKIVTDSLICHDKLVIDGAKTSFTSWSDLPHSMPVVKLGHHRLTPPGAEEGCRDCVGNVKGSLSRVGDVEVTYRNGFVMPYIHTLVADHARISFVTDKHDGVVGNPTLNAFFKTDIFKVRNHVELFSDASKSVEGTLELVSETQMDLVNAAGIYARHLHMEPLGPEKKCERGFNASQLWLANPALTVMATSKFGGFGWLHQDVYVEPEAIIAPGFASLGYDGNCYEWNAGVLRTGNMRLDKLATLRFSIGDKESPFQRAYACEETGSSYQLGQYADCLEVDHLSVAGDVPIELVVRPEGIDLDPDEARCFPIIKYKSVDDQALKNFKLATMKLTSKDHPKIRKTVYLTLQMDVECNVVNLCVAPHPNVVVSREVIMPSLPGVTTNPKAGIHQILSGKDFRFTAKFEHEVMAVSTGRSIKGEDEVIKGVKNENGEYVYVIRQVRQNVKIAFVSDTPTGTLSLDQAAVWTYNGALYIRAERDDIVSVYSVVGQLVERVDIEEGETRIPMRQGVYVIRLKDGTVHKVVVK